jgi:hypothetical protein
MMSVERALSARGDNSHCTHGYDFHAESARRDSLHSSFGEDGCGRSCLFMGFVPKNEAS